jgi:hypothetical protein
MKTSFVLLALAAVTATSCVDHQSRWNGHWRRSQRAGADMSLWQFPSAYVEALGSGPAMADGTPFIPTSGYFAQGTLETGLAPIFNVFREELPSQMAAPSAPPVFDVADRVANASSVPRQEERLEMPRREPVKSESYGHLPYALAVPGKPGFVTVPGHAQLGEVDVVGIASGTPVEVPAGGSTVQFRVP